MIYFFEKALAFIYPYKNQVTIATVSDYGIKVFLEIVIIGCVIKTERKINIRRCYKLYIKKLVYENVGPIERVDIMPSFTADGNPKPILLVGENGTGKSTILSNIVDAFYEMAGQAYGDAWESIDNGHQYYKSIRPADIHVGQTSMFSCIQFQNKRQEDVYLCKCGDLTKENIQEKLDGILLDKLSWKQENNFKGTTVDKAKAEKIFRENVICYFGPDRYEKPAWLGEKYYQDTDPLHIKISERIKDSLENRINVKNVTETNLQWLLDVIADSRADISNSNGLSIVHVRMDDLLLLGAARKNLETIMSRILGINVYFSLNFRNARGSRFRILRENDDSIVAPSLDALSTGQIAMFNTFATIIRYADNNDINQSIHLDRITGIVVIDEIELHLHTNLQKEVLPSLIQLFPKVQFIITTHAPLFLLGMVETFGENGFDVYEMPIASKITVERFSEFHKAFEYLQATQSYQSEVAAAVKRASGQKKVLVITEGSTDWKHMKAAYEKLKSDSNYSEIFDGLNFDFLEYEEKESSNSSPYKINMGCSQLVALCENYAKLPQTTKYICIADRDDQKTNNALSVEGAEFKEWGNNVYSFILPLPKTRENTPAICIEHLYSDAEIKTEYTGSEDGIVRRLYMGGEFDNRGVAVAIDRFCEKKNKCGPDSIAIIEGSSKERVTCLNNDDGINYALPKSQFASLVLSKTPPFDHFDFTNFLPIFETIKHIIEKESI